MCSVCVRARACWAERRGASCTCAGNVCAGNVCAASPGNKKERRARVGRRGEGLHVCVQEMYVQQAQETKRNDIQIDIHTRMLLSIPAVNACVLSSEKATLRTCEEQCACVCAYVRESVECMEPTQRLNFLYVCSAAQAFVFLYADSRTFFCH